MLASCPALSNDPERVCIPPNITQQLGRLAFQRLDALWCSSQGSTPLSFYRYYRGALKFARFVRAEHSADVCPHPHCISLWKPPFRTTASREGSLSAQEECSSCNKKRGVLSNLHPKKEARFAPQMQPLHTPACRWKRYHAEQATSSPVGRHLLFPSSGAYRATRLRPQGS